MTEVRWVGSVGGANPRMPSVLLTSESISENDGTFKNETAGRRTGGAQNTRVACMLHIGIRDKHLVL